VFALRQASRLLVLISQSPNPPNPAGAEACRYSENHPFIFASSEPFAAINSGQANSVSAVSTVDLDSWRGHPRQPAITSVKEVGRGL